MKISRLKKAQKTLAFYVNNYKFRKPYQILIDGTFTFAALQNKVNIQDQLPKYFQSELKLLTTQCIILEIEKLGPKHHGAALIVKQFGVHKCGHEKQPVSGSKCLRSMVKNNNPSRYIIATQDRELQDSVRNKPGVPLLYLHGKTPTLETPSSQNYEKAEELQKKTMMSTLQEETLKTLKQKSGLESDLKEKPFKKRKKGGPNPLSCKKKKINKTKQNVQETKSKNRKRKRIKVPTHLKEILKEKISELAS